ncbi:hypothetical protein LIER_41984 [Lithospermum erythrorhizon]|uniref:Uncharacterized protein n=1 Tax=Lithospermum erythrorhizon TaxID=34254 RepID=A0AAV3RKQ8_LITER
MKSANTYTLILVYGLYRRLNSLNSIAHLTIRLDRLRFSKICLHRMCLKIWLQLPGGNNEGIHQFLFQGVSCLSPSHDPAGIVYRPLNLFLLPYEDTTKCLLRDCQIELQDISSNWQG